MTNKYKSLTVIENRLEELYDKGLQNSEEYRELESKATALAEAETIRQDKMNQALERERIRIDTIRTALLNEDMDVIQLLGETEFRDDYEIRIEGNDYVVYSKVASNEQPNRWICPSMEEAEIKQRYLYYYRLYNKYVRTGDFDKINDVGY